MTHARRQVSLRVGGRLPTDTLRIWQITDGDGNPVLILPEDFPGRSGHLTIWWPAPSSVP